MPPSLRAIIPARLPPPVWCVAAALLITDLAGLVFYHMNLAWLSFTPLVLGVALLAGLRAFYTHIRPDRRLASLASAAIELLIYTALCGILSYLVVRSDLPLIDSTLIMFDHAVGFDWQAQYEGIIAHRMLHILLALVYASLIPQIVIVLGVLNFRGQFQRGRELIWLFMTTSLGSVLVSWLLPAAGAFVAYNITPQDPYVVQFLALRDGTLPVIDLVKMQGVVQFPSFHMALAIILPFAARGVPVLFPLLCVVDGLVMMATPAIGGHHLADLAGGLILTLGCIAAVRQAGFRD